MQEVLLVAALFPKGTQGHGHVWVQGRSGVKTQLALEKLHHHWELWPREVILSHFKFTGSLVRWWQTNLLPEQEWSCPRCEQPLLCFLGGGRREEVNWGKDKG